MKSAVSAAARRGEHSDLPNPRHLRDLRPVCSSFVLIVVEKEKGRPPFGSLPLLIRLVIASSLV